MISWWPSALFIVLQLGFFVVLHAFGGPPWVALGVLACVMQVIADFRLAPLLGMLPAIAWVGASHATGNRELFFPYAMYLAAHVAGQFAPRGRTLATAAGGTVVAAFLAIRMLQAATPRVLAVELAVAFAILAAVVMANLTTATRPWGRGVVAVLASCAGYAGLAL
jgi:hypothetical protein